MFDKPEIPYRSFLPRRIMKIFNGQSNFSTRFFGWKFRGILGNFFGGWEGICEWNWRVCWVLESNWSSEKFHRCTALWRRLKTDRAKSPKNPSHFQEFSKKSPGQVSFSSSRKWALRAELGWPRLFNPPTGKKSQPTKWFIVYPLQSSPRAIEPTKSPKTHRKSMLLPKNPRLDPRKISIKTCLFLRNFCRKKTGFSWMTQRLIKIFRIVRWLNLPIGVSFVDWTRQCFNCVWVELELFLSGFSDVTTSTVFSYRVVSETGKF